MLSDMGMMINRRRIYGGKSLPYDAEIEYLESSGTQFINTNIVPNNYNGLIFTVDYLTTQNLFGENRRFGCYAYRNNNNSSFLMILFVGADYVRVNLSTGGRDKDIRADMTQRRVITIDSINGTATVDDSTYSVNSGGTIPNVYPIYLFATNGRGSANNFTIGRLYKSSISTADNVLRDLIPVRVGTTGYMYDKVSGQLFGNAGTGSFILGPDK